MQAGKNVAASAKSGMEKTKATLQEKGEKMTAHDPVQKQMATEKKEARMAEAECRKQETSEHNAAQKMANTAEARPRYTSGPHVTSAVPVPGHGTGAPAGHVEEGVVTGAGGAPAGHVEEGVVGSRPYGSNAVTGRGA